MSIPIILSLKPDLESADDEDLALLELNALSGSVATPVDAATALQTLRADNPPSDWYGQKLYACRVRHTETERLARRLAFWEAIYIPAQVRQPSGSTGLGRMRDQPRVVTRIETLSRLLEATTRPDWKTRFGSNIDSEQPLPRMEFPVSSGSPSPASRRKNEYLSHPFHKYKAKFFPRLARSLINTTCPTDEGIILDPFVGSGTAMIEASLMGLSSIGLDIDPLSVFISRMKLNLEQFDVDEIAGVAAEIGQMVGGNRQRDLWEEDFKFPNFLLTRRPARMPLEAVAELEATVRQIRSRIRHVQDVWTRSLLLLCLSHSLATKVSLRWMGTGDDRFAMEIAHRSLMSILLSHLKMVIGKMRVYRTLRETGCLAKPAPAFVGINDATNTALRDASISAVVTSPPYLPAASGRETYLRSRAVSLVALGLMAEDEILRREPDLLGSILAVPTSQPIIPQSVSDLARWMAPQRARKPKSAPTVAYFEQIARSLREIRRVLVPGGRAAVVVSKVHTFYEMVSRDIVREFDMAEAVREVGSDPKYGVGMELERCVTIELPKMDFAARPGAKNAYFEAILLFRRNV